MPQLTVFPLGGDIESARPVHNIRDQRSRILLSDALFTSYNRLEISNIRKCHCCSKDVGRPELGKLLLVLVQVNVALSESGLEQIELSKPT